MFNFIQTPIVNGRTVPAIEPLSQGDRAFNSTYSPEPIRVSVALDRWKARPARRAPHQQRGEENRRRFLRKIQNRRRNRPTGHTATSTSQWLKHHGGVSLQERPMRNYRFGRKIKLPATIAIKHQLRMLMAQDEAKKAEADARAEASRRQRREELLAK